MKEAAALIFTNMKVWFQSYQCKHVSEAVAAKRLPGVPGSPRGPASPLSPLAPNESPLVSDSYTDTRTYDKEPKQLHSYSFMNNMLKSQKCGLYKKCKHERLKHWCQYFKTPFRKS